jgi:hypothetical protein
MAEYVFESDYQGGRHNTTFGPLRLQEAGLSSGIMSQMSCCWLNPARKVPRIILLRIIQLGFGLWARFRDRSPDAW